MADRYMAYDNGQPDRWGPMVPQGESPPLTEGRDAFLGKPIMLPPTRWVGRHGNAFVAYVNNAYVYNCPIRIWGARLPDGRTVHCRRSPVTPLSDGAPWRRRSDDGRGWRPGTVEIRPDSVRFTDGTPLPYSNDISHGLGSSLAKSTRFMSRLQDDSFAWALCALLDSHKYRKAGSDRIHFLVSLRGNKGAGEMIARLRGAGEQGDDFRPGGPDPQPPVIDANDVIEELRRAGWHIVTAEERSKLHAQAWKLLRAYESRPAGPGPDWQPDIPRAVRDRYGLIDAPFYIALATNADQTQLKELNGRARLLVMALLGQITHAEFEALKVLPDGDYSGFERRPKGGTPDWAEGFEQELQSIQTEQMAVVFPRWRTMTPEQREVMFFPRLRDRLRSLAQSGRVTKDEFSQLLVMLDLPRPDW